MYIRTPERIKWIQSFLNKNDNHPDFSSEIKKQILFTSKDIKPDAIKIGMLHSVEVINAVLKSLNKIKVKNYSSDFLILHDGEIIVGAKQNRTIDKSVILKPKETRNVDVLCVEKGRWSFRNHEFSQHNSKLSPEIRFSKEIVKNYNNESLIYTSTRPRDT